MLAPQGALEAAEKQHVIMYMSEPAPQRVTPRKLQEKVEKVCNSECMVRHLLHPPSLPPLRTIFLLK